MTDIERTEWLRRAALENAIASGEMEGRVGSNLFATPKKPGCTCITFGTREEAGSPNCGSPALSRSHR
jgi:hypothetical protein